VCEHVQFFDLGCVPMEQIDSSVHALSRERSARLSREILIYKKNQSVVETEIVDVRDLRNELVTMLVVPLLANPGKEKKALGVVLMQNKREFDGEVSEFNEEDIEVMETFAKYFPRFLFAVQCSVFTVFLRFLRLR